MELREQCKKLFESFLICLKQNKIDDISDLFTETATLDAMIIGIHQGNKDIAKALYWKGTSFDDYRIRVTNFAAHAGEEMIYQSAYIQAIVSYEKDGFCHWFLYGGHFSNDIPKDENMRFSAMRFDLDYVDGNTSFVAGWWKLIDYHCFMGQKLRSSIIGEIDSPWIKAKSIQYESDYEEIVDVMYHYAFAMDTADFADLQTTYSENVTAHMPQGNFEGRHDFTAYFKWVRLKEPTFSHAIVVKEIRINGNKASSVFLRTEPNRRGTAFLNKENKNCVFFTGIYHNEFLKTGGKWYLSKDNYESLGHPLIMPVPKNLHFLEDMKFE